MYKQMTKLFVDIVSYTILTLGLAQEILSDKVVELLKLKSTTTDIIIYIGIFFWIVKGIWYIYSKFYLENRERLKKLND